MKKRIFQLLVLILVVSLCGSAFAYAATVKNITTAKKTVTISWNNPQDITYGTKLDSTQLNATATYNGVAVSGTYAYSPSVGTILSPGSQQTLKVTFTPTNRRVYSTAYKEVKINVLSSVTKVTPVISWATPADIVAGTPLSSTQLNAAASYNGITVAGTYAYSPSTGTILSAGASQTLKVTFTPSDAVKYNSAYKEVKINVLAPVVNPPADIPADAINVKTQYGAKGDGITDDTASINNAISYAYSKGGGTVYIPDGT